MICYKCIQLMAERGRIAVQMAKEANDVQGAETVVAVLREAWLVINEMDRYYCRHKKPFWPWTRKRLTAWSVPDLIGMVTS